MFASPRDANKLIRKWDALDGQHGRVSVETNETYVAVVGGGRADDLIRARGPQSGWVGVEGWLDLDTNTIETKIFNIRTAKVVDVLVEIANPDANCNGYFVQVIGYDDGDNDTATFEFRIADVYVADSQARVEIGTSSDPERARYREVQQTVSRVDGEVKYKLDGINVDPANNWQYVYDHIGIITHIIPQGSPVELKQNIARPTFGEVNAAALYATIASPYQALSAGYTGFNYETAFFIFSGACDSVDFIYNGVNDRIRYILATEQWQVRFGGGDIITVDSTEGGFDSETKRRMKLESTTTGFSIYVADYIEDQAEEDVLWTLDATGAGTLNPPTIAQFCRANGGTAGELKGYMWETKLTDVNAGPTNSKYWKLDEQVGAGQNTHIKNYAEDVNGVDDRLFFETFDTGWDWFPGEGY